MVAYVAPASGLAPAKASEVAVRTQFQKAHKYARAAQHKPELWIKYQNEAILRDTNPLDLAITDFMKSPAILEVCLDQYQGKAGDHIRILAIDDFRIAGVQVTITNGDGETVESGAAIYKSETGDWQYKARIVNPVIKGSRIRIEARDLPGNCSSLEREL